MDGVAHSLLAASEVLRYLRDLIPPRTRQEHLGTAQSESVFGAQSGFEPLALLSRQRTCEDRWFHGSYHNSQSGTYTDDALGKESGGSRNFRDGVVGNNGPDGGTGIYANLTNSTEDSYSQVSTQGLARIASLV